MLLGRTALVVKSHPPVRLHRLVGDDEAGTREQLAWMPFDLGNHPAFLGPGRGSILEILEEPLHLGLRRSTHGPCEPMGDLLAHSGVGGQLDGVEEPAAKVAVSIAGDHRIEGVPPSIGAVHVTMPHGTAFQHAELVEQEVWVVAGTVEIPIPGGAFLIAMGRADRTPIAGTSRRADGACSCRPGCRAMLLLRDGTA